MGWRMLAGRVLVVLLVAGQVAVATARAAEDRARPNVVVILADDFGYECVRANGGEYETPRLDELAAGGARFTLAFATPLCTPSRVELMTGRYNCRNYVSFGQFDFRETTFAGVLRSQGYRTTVIGKWQLEGGVDGPNRAGFDEHYVWQLTAEEKGSRYWHPKLFRNGEQVTGVEYKYGPDLCAEAACDFIERNKDRPFVAYLPMMLTHGPFEPPPRDDEAAPPKKPKGNAKHFPAMVRHLDRNVGRILDKRSELGLQERTLVVFTGDNGSPREIRSRLGEREIRGGKGTIRDAGWHVPLIVSWPGRIAAGQVREELVDFTDLFPTLAEAAGVSVPEPSRLDGRSFLPVVLGKKGTPRDWVYLHYEPRHGNQNNIQRVVRERRWKLVDDGRLFDLKADPEDERPVTASSDSSESGAARRRLEAVLAGFPAKAPRERSRESQ